MSVEETAVDQIENNDEFQEIESQPETEEVETGETPAETETEDGDIIVTFGEDSPPQEDEDDFEGKPAPQWVKDLRKENRELKKQLKTAPAEQPKEESITLGQKPTLEQFGYDEESFSEAIDIWYEQRDKFNKQKADAEAKAKAQQAEFKVVLDSYNEKKSQLKARDFDDAEHNVADKLSVQQQAFILEGADNPALIVYGLGKNKSRLEELAKITNPAKFAFAVAKLEAQLKTTNRKAPPAPESKVSSSGSTAGTTDTTLNRLREEAERTGDFSKLGAYKRKQKQLK